MEDFFNTDPETMNNKVLADRARQLKYGRSDPDMQIVREYLTEEEWDAAIKEGTEIGVGIGTEIGTDIGISNMIQENIEDDTPTERIVAKLGKYYSLDYEEAIRRISEERRKMEKS